MSERAFEALLFCLVVAGGAGIAVGVLRGAWVVMEWVR